MMNLISFYPEQTKEMLDLIGVDTSRECIGLSKYRAYRRRLIGKTRMKEINYYIAEGERKPRKMLRQCVVCHKKKHLLYYLTTNDFILQICNKCLDALSEDSE